MTDREITELKAEIARLSKQIAELQECSFKHFEMFTTHLIEQDQEIGDLYSYIMPILRKTYPGFAATKKQFDSVLKRKTTRYIDDPNKKST